MPDLPDIAATLAGVAILLVMVREIFCQLFHPEGDDSIGRWIFRGGRAIARRTNTTGQVITGPICVIAVIGMWLLLATIGWTMLLVPHVPSGIAYGDGVASHGTLADAAYLSFVSISTLGFGDLTPDTLLLRLLWPLQAIMGFGIITAGMTWGLSAFGPLGRQRSVARYVNLVLREPELDAATLEELSRMVTSATIDVKLAPVTYYIVPVSPQESLPGVVVRLWDVAEAARRDPDRASAATRLLRALDDLGEQLVTTHLAPAPLRDVHGRARLAAYRDDAEPRGRIAPQASGSTRRALS
ncbi:MAG: Ion transport 2 domain protein [Thermoleophilia bacterium]|nr:Ion transport 2 domain protein [Thermoleophilia bacterium]